VNHRSDQPNEITTVVQTDRFASVAETNRRDLLILVKKTSPYYQMSEFNRAGAALLANFSHPG
jgi:hypothetical protein